MCNTNTKLKRNIFNEKICTKKFEAFWLVLHIENKANYEYNFIKLKNYIQRKSLKLFGGENMKDIEITVKDESGLYSEEKVTKLARESAEILERVKAGEERYSESLGWLNVSEWAGEEWLSKYEELAKEVRENADALVVVGIGGSNQAARAVYEAVKEKNGVELIWAGNTISARGITEVLDAIRGRRVYIDVIAKNFETLEPGIAFRALRDYMKKEYGEGYASRVICTGTEGERLWELCSENGYHFLPFPKNIGGRYTAMSPIGLFPLCAAGVDIRAIAEGAKHMRDRLIHEGTEENIALKYAALRNLLYENGITVEMLAFFEPVLFRFGKWWMQLFGESEGKDDKGIFPMLGNFSEDLHSIGQYIQSGSRIMFETFIDVEHQEASYILHDDMDDGFHYLDGWDFHNINKAAFNATVSAHSRRFPCVVLSVPALDEETFGQLFYFFQFSCYLSGSILGVNPFDQPGVEAYKNDMFKLLGKY